MSHHLRQCLLASAVVGSLFSTSIGVSFAQDGGATTSAAQATGTTGSNANGGVAVPAAVSAGQPAGTVAQAGTNTPPPGGGEGTVPNVSGTPAAATSTVATAGQSTTPPPGGGEGTVSAVDAAVLASGSQVPPAAYLKGEDRISVDEIETFLTQPRAYLDEQPVVAERVSARTERLVGSDQRTVPPIIALAVAPETQTDQRAMIAVGMARATRAAEPVAPEYAAYLQEAVALSGSESFIMAYNVAFQTSEIETASIGSGGPAGASANGGTLSGGGDSGISGAIGGDDVVPQTSFTPSFSSGRSIIAADNGSDGSNGAVIVIVCTDASPTLPNCVAR